jgi:hypothetical protein
MRYEFIVRCYRSIIGNAPSVLWEDNDRFDLDILFSPEEARELGQKLIAAADRADRQEFERWNSSAACWESVDR